MYDYVSTLKVLHLDDAGVDEDHITGTAFGRTAPNFASWLSSLSSVRR